MNDEHNAVRLEVASRHHAPFRWESMHKGNLSNVDSAVVFLRHSKELLTTENVFQIVRVSDGEVLMDDLVLRNEVASK